MTSYNKQMRLYLLNIVINPSKCEDQCDNDLVRGWKTMEDVVSGLHSVGVVSDIYDERHLEIDLWHLNKRVLDPLPEFRSGCSDPASMLMFRIIVQALRDLQSGRPCDLGLWIADEPPDRKKCFPWEHCCYVHAEDYLRSLHDIECMVNLSDEFLSNLLRKIKRDPIFNVRSLFVQRLRTDCNTFASFT